MSHKASEFKWKQNDRNFANNSEDVSITGISEIHLSSQCGHQVSQWCLDNDATSHLCSGLEHLLR